MGKLFLNPEAPSSLKLTKTLANSKAEANKNIYLFLLPVKDKDTSKKIPLNTIRITEPKNRILLVINSPDSNFIDTAAIDAYIRSDTGRKYGVAFYSKNEIRRLQKQKNIDSMTTKDFKRYAAKFMEFKRERDSLSETKESYEKMND